MSLTADHPAFTNGARSSAVNLPNFSNISRLRRNCSKQTHVGSSSSVKYCCKLAANPTGTATPPTGIFPFATKYSCANADNFTFALIVSDTARPKFFEKLSNTPIISSSPTPAFNTSSTRVLVDEKKLLVNNPSACPAIGPPPAFNDSNTPSKFLLTFKIACTRVETLPQAPAS